MITQTAAHGDSTCTFSIDETIPALVSFEIVAGAGPARLVLLNDDESEKESFDVADGQTLSRTLTQPHPCVVTVRNGKTHYSFLHRFEG